MDGRALVQDLERRTLRHSPREPRRNASRTTSSRGSGSRWAGSWHPLATRSSSCKPARHERGPYRPSVSLRVADPRSNEGFGLPTDVAMAPGGVEPPHADSKSAALSTELRGPGADRVSPLASRRSAAFRLARQASRLSTRTRVIASRALASAVPRCGTRTTFGSPNSSSGTRGSWTNTSRPGADAARDELAHERVLVHNRASRGVDRQAPSRMSASRRASIRRLGLGRVRDVQGDDVGFGEQVVELAVLDPERALLRGGKTGALRVEDAHVERPGPTRHARPTPPRPTIPSVAPLTSSPISSSSAQPLPQRRPARSDRPPRSAGGPRASARTQDPRSARRPRPACW